VLHLGRLRLCFKAILRTDAIVYFPEASVTKGKHMISTTFNYGLRLFSFIADTDAKFTRVLLKSYSSSGSLHKKLFDPNLKLPVKANSLP
jgi:hypothetical protein